LAQRTAAVGLTDRGSLVLPALMGRSPAAAGDDGTATRRSEAGLIGLLFSFLRHCGL